MTKNLHLCKKIMEEIIRHIHMEMLQAHCDAQSYIDDYMFLTERLENVFQENKNVKLEVFLMLYCEEGEVKLELNNATQYLQANDLLISLPNTIIGQVMANPNHKVKIFCFSNRFIQRLTQTQKYSWKSICYIQENPIKHFEKKRNETFHQYLKLIEDKIQTPPDKYQKEILLHITSAFFEEMIAETTRKSIEKEAAGHHTLVKQPDFIFKQFMEALAADNGKHRTLSYYADSFCYSAKYLSRIVKQISGKNALTLIHENAIEHIITELKYSPKSIKEIAVDFDFPNVSFFAQYVKKHLGMTPTEYRSCNQTKDL